MPFKFIHTADWQIGRSFGRFDAELGAQLRLARLDAIDRIAEHARTRGVKHVLVAGDVWDQDTPSDKTLHATLERLGHSDDVVWWLLPGNHDPARANGLWDRLLQSELFVVPENVRALLAPEPIVIEPNVYVLPAPWFSKLPDIDLTTWMDGAETPEHALRIGLAHGAVHGFGGEDEDHAQIAADRASRARLDYLALGDWHGVKQIDARTWYAGTPEPDRFPRNDPGFCLEVSVENVGSQPLVTPLETAQFTWHKSEISVTPGMRAREIFEEIFAHAPPNQKTLIELTLTGRLRAEDRVAFNQEIARLRDALAYLELRSEELQTLVDVADLDGLGEVGSLRWAGEQLLAGAQDQSRSEDQRRDARHALALLFTFAKDVVDASEGL